MRYESSYILKYLEPIIDVQFIALYVDYIFDEDYFLALDGDKSQKLKERWEISYTYCKT